ncbi:MAG: riboflavin synthase [Bacteroidetes bacterium]|nr:MAG: riboflavin synthase [Bacteroidota bacterium]
MFSGIIESLGKVESIQANKGNLTFKILSLLANELKIDQSVAHNGVCLTVVNIENTYYEVTAIAETLEKTNLGTLNVGDWVNLERCIRLNDRLDGHIVQGHVDQTGICTKAQEQNGSWLYSFEYDASKGNVTVEKGSVCVNGVSLTVVNSTQNGFSVAIIPYTYEHTTFQFLKPGDAVNLEFDILGKYIARLMQR